MQKKLQKSLQAYISKLKRPSSSPPSSPQNPLATTTSRLLSACKYPRTLSIAANREQSNSQDNAATLADIDRFLFENFGSLYNDEIDSNGVDDKNVISSDSRRFFHIPLNLRASQPFFVSPGTSNSPIEEARSSASTIADHHDLPPVLSEQDEPALTDHTIAVLTCSKDPYGDFHRSMHDVVEAHQSGECQRVDWDFLEELLFCYLNLNEHKAHKYILGAFVDLMVSFRRDCDRIPASQHKIPVTRRAGKWKEEL